MISTTFFFFIVLLFAVLIAFGFILMKSDFDSKHKSALADNLDLKTERDKLVADSTIISFEKNKFNSEKKKIEEKNKKLWQMSEAVYKEKKKVDDENEELIIQKEKLAAEKFKVDEKVKKLWSQSLAIHKEKERINELKIEIEHKHNEIIDSVNYAKRIQEAILPDKKEILSHLNNSFILFKPRDIVSGDFYWYSFKNNRSIIAAVDCTGHGVPGAFMSMIGNTLLNQIVNEKGITDPAQILNSLNEEVNASLKQTQTDSESRDGMDIAICSFDMENLDMQYAGANRPLYLIKNGELIETKANKFPIGGLDYDVPKIFTTHSFQLQANDCIYISTDGFADQFSPEDKKLMTKKFKETLVLINDKSMEDQRDYLNLFIDNWKGNTEQTDDILVIGVRV
jgi:serine phosphatase RsbU (regulator of sigma subunit)